MADSKRRGEDAVDERLDEALDEDVLDDEALEFDEDEDEDDESAAGGTKTKAKPRRAGGVDKAKDKVKPKVKTGERPNIFARIRNFIREVIGELAKVIWPTRKELLTYTGVVVVFVAVVTAIVAGLDVAFAKGVLYVFGDPNAAE